jgi:hypothetical protein
MFRMIGFTGDKPKVAPATKLLLIKDKPGLKTLLHELAATPDLKRVIVSHGDAIVDAPGEALRGAASF